MKRKRRALSASGGGTQITELYGGMEVLLYHPDRSDRWVPDVLIGTSAGAILVFLYLMGLFLKRKPQVLSFTAAGFFGVQPVNSRGVPTLSAIVRQLCGKKGLGTMEGLEDKLKQYVTKERFTKYVNAYGAPDCYVSMVNLLTGEIVRPNLKYCLYEDAIKYVVASATIPAYTQGFSLNYAGEDMYLVDGGVLEHNGGAWLAEKYRPVQHYSLYSRAEAIVPRDKAKKLKTTLDDLERTIDLQSKGISVGNAEKELVMWEKYNVAGTQVFFPEDLPSVYTTDQELLTNLYEEGKKVMASTLHL